MKFTLAWLKEHLETDASLGTIVDKLTMIGLEVERVEDKAKELAPFRVASVASAEKHPNADKLRVCMVDLGDGKPIGNLDGLEPLDATGYLVTDWVAGALYRIDVSGRADLWLDLNQGSADIGYVPAEHLLLIPMMKDDKLVAYRIE